MKTVLSCLLLTVSVGCGAQAFADDQPQMTKEQKMDACMKKQMAVDAKVPQAVVKKHCEDTVNKSKESTGPVAGTVDPTKS